MAKLENEVLKLMREGVYDPSLLFDILYHKHVVHYARLREAIHNAKQR